MAIRYTPEELKHLRESPLVVKPPGLPPVEQWMGPPSDPTRNSAKAIADRSKNHDSHMLLEQANRRSGAERHMSRNSANPEDIILGPPKTSFMSSTSIRSGNKPFDSTDRPPLRDAEPRDRYNFRTKTGDGENERVRDGRNNNLRPKRAEGDQDSDGWSTVKHRKSFGTEGAERFNGRMGVDRHRDDRRFKDREDRDTKERPPRGFETFSRDKDTTDQDQERDGRRNGTGRGRNEPSWFKDINDSPPTPTDRNSNGDRFADRTRGWREKERDERAENRGAERGGDRGDRRWDRHGEQRQERDPEWMDEPADERGQSHTQEDFQKWKEQMQGKDKAGNARTPVEEAPSKGDPSGQGSFFGLENQKVETPLPMDTGPDKFFGMWAPKDDEDPESRVESKKEGISKSKSAGRASRFTSFFSPQEEPLRRQTDPPPPIPAPPPNGFNALFQNNSQSSAEKEAFQQLLQKLQRQTMGANGPSPPPANISLQPKPPVPEKQGPPSEPIQYRLERQDDGRASTRNSQQALQDLLSQRQIAGSQPTVRHEQMLQELVGHRQNALSQSSVRPDQAPTRNSNTDFLMGLMQSAKAGPEPPRPDQQHLLRMPPQKPVDRQMQQQQQQMMDREQEMQREAAAHRERSASQRQIRPQAPPGFFDDPSYQRGPPPQHEGNNRNPPQPTQILQRPPPPGLDQMPPGWAQPPAQLPPPQQQIRHIAPPPGLAGGPSRGMPMPQQMFPPGFPMGNFPPPDAMAGPPRMQPMQPPPGFFNAPPPGFLPPGMSGFQGPEGMAFGGPFDGRGLPPQGAFRRQ